jgi:translation initiation factor 2 subunit 3
MALEITGVKNIIIVQNKIDLLSEEDALKNYNDIKNFVKGSIAENAPIIPISAQHNVNIDTLIETIEKVIPTPKRDPDKDPIMFVTRSFDINKPGTEVPKLNGGVLGGALKQGVLKINDEIEIRPGHKIEKEGIVKFESIKTKIIGLRTGETNIKEATPGGSIAVLTELDPAYVKADKLTGNIVGSLGKLPPLWTDLDLKPHLLKAAIGTQEETLVEPIKKGEVLMLNVNSSVTVGTVFELKKDIVKLKLKIAVCAAKTDRITISRRFGTRWRLIGWGEIK